MSLGRYRVCSSPGCGVLVIAGAGKCARCRALNARLFDARRPSSSARGYGPEWRQRREWFLAEHPFCCDCDAEATVADHDPVSRAELVRRGGPDPDAFHHLKPRCASCHGRRTVRDDGGFGRLPADGDRAA